MSSIRGIYVARVLIVLAMERAGGRVSGKVGAFGLVP